MDFIWFWMDDNQQLGNISNFSNKLSNAGFGCSMSLSICKGKKTHTKKNSKRENYIFAKNKINMRYLCVSAILPKIHM